MLRKVHLHGRLGKLHGRVHEYDVSTAAEALRALASQCPGFTRTLMEGKAYRLVRGGKEGTHLIGREALELNLGRHRELHIIPSPVVSGIETLIYAAIVLVVAIVAVVVFTPKIEPPDPNDREDERKSFVFDGPSNVTEQGHPVPLVYGFGVRCGSVVASAGIEVSDIPYSGLPGSSSPGWNLHPLGDDLVFTSKGGKGAGSQRPPRESPNTLQSQAVARIIDVISEGEIGGLVNGMKSVFYDGTPVQNQDDTFNFKGVAIEERVGLPDQPHVPGYAQQETPVDVSADITQQIGPITRTITDADVNRVRVTLRLNALSFLDSATGDLLPTSVAVKIELQSDGGGFTQVVNHTFQGKTTSTYQKNFTISLPPGGDPWDVRVSRVTPDRTLAVYQDDIVWDFYTTLIDAKVTYPDTALIATTVDAKQFGAQVPARAYEVDGILCEVPVNYNPVTRAYTGEWNGTFVRAVTNNPAWIFRDIVVNNRYGLGRRVDAAMVDKFTLYSIAQHNDGFVPDGLGMQEPRHTFNGVLNARKEAYDFLAAVASTFRSNVYWSSGLVTLAQDKPTDPSKLITVSNTAEDRRPVYDTGDLSSMFSAVMVSWNDPNDGWRLAIEVVEDADLRNEIGWETVDAVALGCSSRGQAIRFGRWFLEDQRSGFESVRYATGLDQADVFPGQVISLHDNRVAGTAVGGRVVSATTTSLTLDREVTLAAGEVWHVLVMRPDGTILDAALTNGPLPVTTSVLTFGAVLGSLPIAGAVWSVRPESLAEATQWRVRGIREVDETEFELHATSHDPNKYDRVEQNLIFEELPLPVLAPSGPIPRPVGLTITEFLKITGNAAIPSLQFSFRPVTDVRVTIYQVQYKPPDGDWVPHPDQSSVSAEVIGVIPGLQAFRVRSCDSAGRKSAWTELSEELDGLPPPPGDVQMFEAYPGDDLIRFVWQVVLSPYPISYEIRSGETWETAQPVVHAQDTDTVTVKLPTSLTVNKTFWIKAVVLHTQLYSVNARPTRTSQENLPTRNLVITHDDPPSWPGVSLDMTETDLGDGDVLLIDKVGGVNYPFGDYYVQVDLGSTFYARAWLEAEVTRTVGDGPTWDDLSATTWDMLADTPWAQQLEITDVALTSFLATDTRPSDSIDGTRLNGTTSLLDFGAPTSSANLGAYAELKSANGLTFAANTVVTWDTSQLNTNVWTALIDVRPTSASPANGTRIFRLGGPTADDFVVLMYLTGPNRINALFSNGAGANVDVAIEVTLDTTDIYTIGVAENGTDKRLFLRSRRDPTVRSASGTAEARSLATRWQLGDTSGGSLAFPGVYGDFELRSSFTDTAEQFNELATFRGPVGFAQFRLFVPGDYGFRNGVIWTRVAAAQNFADNLFIDVHKLTVDVPDIFDSGTNAAVAAAPGTTISFNRTFSVAPSVTAQWRSGAALSTVQVSNITTTGFDADVFQVSNQAQIAGNIDWQAHGY